MCQEPKTQEDAQSVYQLLIERLTQEKFKEYLHYNPETGVFIWKQVLARRIKIGDNAGCADSNGYIKIQIRGQQYLASRLAWFYSYGNWPTEIDHIDGNTSNNKLANLREATSSQNKMNRGVRSDNKLGIKGVYEQRGRYSARITINGNKMHLGTFDTAEEAAEAYEEAAKKHFGEFANG